MNGEDGRFSERATNVFKRWPEHKAPYSEAEEQLGSEELWRELEKEHLTLVSVPEDSGGPGGSLADALEILRAGGRHAVPIELVETALLGGWLLYESGLPLPSGPLTAAPVHPDETIEFHEVHGGWSLSGCARRVPAARSATRLAILGRGGGGKKLVASVDPAACAIEFGENLAGEARDDVILNGVRVTDREVARAGTGVEEEKIRLLGALSRSALMAGALEGVLELTVSYAMDRQQFGRPIGKFQAIQQQIAMLAGEVAAASAATNAAIHAAQRGDGLFEIAAAKFRVSEAAGVCASVAHQVHGAIGFTERHVLPNYTRRLWAWRDEFGTESEWATRLGGLVIEGGPENLWPTLTAMPRASW